jgi:uncharacterized protein (TIGR02453 family)
VATPHFTKATFDFLRDLDANNDRDWFAENKDRYQKHVKAPALALVSAMGPELNRISNHFTATPRSLFRIHRDVRFSKDKRPYKTTVGVHFRHERAKSAHAPGYYLHVEPGNVFVGVGIWHPEPAALRKIREHIAENPAGWKRATGAKAFRSSYELAGDRLKRAPKGFDPEHPMIDALRWKDHIGVRQLTQSFVTSEKLPKELGRTFAAGTPFMKFLCASLDVPF